MKKLLFLMVFLSKTLLAQKDTVYLYTFPPNAAAFTECNGGHIKTMIDVSILGTDSLKEILKHEEAHRDRYQLAYPNCYFPEDSVPWGDSVITASLEVQGVLHEVDAYCSSLNVYVEKYSDGIQSIMKRRRLLDYINKIYRQFGGNYSFNFITNLFVTSKCI